MDPVAFTLRHDSLTHDLMTPVRIHDAHISTEQVTSDSFLSYDALWDTGAMASVISTEVVQALGLSPISQCMTYHAQGQSVVNVYMVDMILPNKKLNIAENGLRGCTIARTDCTISGYNVGQTLCRKRENDTKKAEQKSAFLR